jgi:hypothetical protein
LAFNLSMVAVRLRVIACLTGLTSREGGDQPDLDVLRKKCTGQGQTGGDKQNSGFDGHSFLLVFERLLSASAMLRKQGNDGRCSARRRSIWRAGTRMV